MSAETVARLLQSADGRRELSKASPVFFDTYYCGMRFASHRENWLDEFERVRSEAHETGRKGALLLLAPRDHGKTEACVTACVRWICQDRNIRILWISESQAQAEKRMRRVKAVMESKRVIDDWCSAPEQGYRPFREDESRDRWMSTQVYVARDLQSVDPTLEAVGAGGAVTGGHFDIIMCDDLEDDRTTYSAANRARTREWFKGTVRPMLVRGGTMIVVGTRKHHDDLYGHMRDDPTVEIVENKAISVWPESYKMRYEERRGKDRLVGIDYTGDVEVLWPEERDIEYLLMEREAVGGRLFNREFQNEVVDDLSSAIRWEWLEAAVERGSELSLYQVPPQVTDIVQGWDFALVTDVHRAESRDTDYTVGVTWGKDDEGNRYLLGLRRVRGLSSAAIRETVQSEYQRFGSAVRAISVERNNFGELHFLGLKNETDLPVRAHTTTGKSKADPWDGVPAVSMLFETGKVIIPSATARDKEATQPMIQELWGFGRERHDDTVMALWIAEMVLRKSAFVYRLSFGDEEDISSDGEDEGGYDEQISELERNSVWAGLVPPR